MESTFLPGVQNNPQPSPYADLIRTMQAAGSEYMQTWHLFAFKPEMTAHLARFSQALLREPATESRSPRTDRRIHVGAESLPVLHESSCRIRSRAARKRARNQRRGIR